MSRRRSTGDLVPWDVSEIIGRELKAQRGHRKPGSSLGQAISWLRSSQKRRKKTKKSLDNGGRQPAVADGLQSQDAAKAGTKNNDEQKKLGAHYSASQHFQENVFIEADRPQYLEDLHSEAREGLKILQQEGHQQEHDSGGNCGEDESCASSDTGHPDDDLHSKDESGSLESNSGINDTTRTSRPVLTRQSSTFKPLYSVKRLDKNRKRNRRTTIMGIPNQVQKELALHRCSTTQQPNNNNQSGSLIIPTLDGGTPVMTKEGARVHLSELEITDKHLQEVSKNNDQQSFGSPRCRSSVIRPKSVAVPGLTTFNPLMSFLSEPQGPVMSVSPQATYLSTIIPNAVLPAGIEVIEIDRGSVKSAHAVSKNSPAASVTSSASPFLSRKSDCDSFRADTSFNNPTTHKADLNLEDTRVNPTGDRELGVQSLTPDSEPIMSCPSRDEVKIKRNSTRSLSVIKTKLPPAPPRRSNSLYLTKIQKSQAEGKDRKVSSEELQSVTSNIPDPVSTCLAEPKSQSSNPSQDSSCEAKTAQESVSEFKHPSEGEKFERTISPSSGYSSQSGTPTLSPKDMAPDKHKIKPVKPERSASRASSSASPSSSLTSLSSGTSDPVNSDVSNSCTSDLPAKELTSPLRLEVKELWTVPPPPKVKAPCPPPPETWAQNSHTFALLCGPSPQTDKVVPESTKAQESTVTEEGSQTGFETRDKAEATETNPKDEKLFCEIQTHQVEENTECLASLVCLAKDEIETTPKEEGQGTNDISAKKEPPPVMKKPQLKEDVMLTEEPKGESCHTTTINDSVDEVQSNCVEPQNIPKNSPPPSPPPPYQPTPPRSRKSPPTSISTLPVELEGIEEEGRAAESSWPPPPPPLEGESVFDGGDEIEFPLPPPPDNIQAEDSCASETVVSDTPLEKSEPGQSTPPDAVQDAGPAGPSPPSSSSNSRAEIQPSSGSFLKRHSLEMESQSRSESPDTSQLPTPSPMENLAFRRPPSTAHRDNRNKELLARHKSMPIPKEDANIPLVTPSLLHMVRLRTVSTSEESPEASTQQRTPPKPTRKSLQCSPQVVKKYVTPNTPSMRLQEAIRIKTAALSSREGLPCRLGTRASYHCAGEPGVLSFKSSDTQRLPASTASFIFSRSTKKTVMDTARPGSSPEGQTNVKQNSAADLVRLSDPGTKSERVPPPVARKPSQGSVGFSQNACAARMEMGVPARDPMGAQQRSKGIPLPETTTRVTADTIETLF
ncbi:NHS-like protein 3 isoform X1 [Syngnathus scovelli]|uniref:NHS-like protein 3 isoform X1 n=1 Tax=Syngnathus scovelli TaxID=161590 RepID=UPI00210F35E8|nr:uncharacterized protein KIAA1522 homolog isoform X1 [Syngnathus scovelli]